MPFVYMLRCAGGSLYTGAAVDLTARIERHRKGLGSRYTRAHLPVKLVFSREVRTWSLALKEEHRLKSLRRADKLALLRASRKVR